MKILFFEPYAIWTPHFETCLEIMQNHLDQGAQVTFLGCNASLPSCDPNPNHDLVICLQCIRKRRLGLHLLSKKVKCKSVIKLSDNDKKQLKRLQKTFKDIDELKQYSVDDFDIGMAVSSSLISILRDPYPDLLENQLLTYRLLRSSYKDYLSLMNYLESDSFNRVYVFNGRFAPLRGVLRACEKKKVDCFIHERGCNINHYAIYENALPIDLQYNEKLIRESWEDAEKKDKEQIASDFYRDRVQGKEQSWYSYIVKQEKGLLPQEWDVNKENIVIFNSSEDEFAAIGEEWKNPLYRTQIEGIERIVASMAEYSERFHVYLRIHPNLSGVQNKSVIELFNITAKNFTVVPPDSKISTYALVQAANKVVTFGSTVGIEAVFWEKPSILAGMSLYRNLDSVYTPSSHEELIEMLLSDLPPKNKEGALIYGYYLNTFGIPFKYYKTEGLFTGKFKNTEIQLLHPPRFISRIYQSKISKAILAKISKIHSALVSS